MHDRRDAGPSCRDGRHGIALRPPRHARPSCQTSAARRRARSRHRNAQRSLQLVAVENLVFASAWHAGNEEPPKFHGRIWPLLKDDAATKVDEAHGWEPHYEQHLWVFRDNPNGAYSPFNPKVSCKYHKPPPGSPHPMPGR
jgi:hypothetical protein